MCRVSSGGGVLCMFAGGGGGGRCLVAEFWYTLSILLQALHVELRNSPFSGSQGNSGFHREEILRARKALEVWATFAH